MSFDEVLDLAANESFLLLKKIHYKTPGRVESRRSRGKKKHPLFRTTPSRTKPTQGRFLLEHLIPTRLVDISFCFTTTSLVGLIFVKTWTVWGLSATWCSWDGNGARALVVFGSQRGHEHMVYVAVAVAVAVVANCVPCTHARRETCGTFDTNPTTPHQHPIPASAPSALPHPTFT